MLGTMIRLYCLFKKFSETMHCFYNGLLILFHVTTWYYVARTIYYPHYILYACFQSMCNIYIIHAMHNISGSLAKFLDKSIIFGMQALYTWCTYLFQEARYRTQDKCSLELHASTVLFPIPEQYIGYQY